MTKRDAVGFCEVHEAVYRLKYGCGFCWANEARRRKVRQSLERLQATARMLREKK